MEPESKRPKLVGGYINEGGKNTLSILPMNYTEQESDEDVHDENNFNLHKEAAKYKINFNQITEQVPNKESEGNQMSAFQKLFHKVFQNDENETVLLSDLEQAGSKIQRVYSKQTEIITYFPAYTLITNADKGKINKRRYILKSMLQPYFRNKAKQQFISLAKKMNFSPLIEDFEKKDDQFDKCFEWYCLSCFYHYSLNKGLRAFESADECFYLRLIYKDLFISILERYQYEPKESFTCWRRTYMKESEINKLQKNIKEYIQLQGFISTSRTIQAVENLDGNVLIEIYVPEQQSSDPGKIFQYGFTDISKKSKYDEFEILFNSINYFQVFDVIKLNTKQKLQEGQKEKYKWHIKLNYCRLSSIEAKTKKTPKQEELWRNYLYQERKTQKIKNQGDCFFECMQYEKCLEWLDLRFTQIQEQFRKKFGGEITSPKDIDQREQKQIFFKEYVNALFLQASCLNNLKKYEQAKNKIQQCKDFYDTRIKQRNENYNFILKAKGNILLNCGQTKQGLRELQKAIKLIDKVEKITEKIKNQFKDEIMRTFHYWKDMQNLKLDEEMEKKLKDIKQNRGITNQFYSATLKNTFIVLYEKDKWSDIIKLYHQTLKDEKYIEENELPEIITKRESNFYVYVSCLSYLELNEDKKAQKNLQKFIGNLASQNDGNTSIFCSEANMFLHLVTTFYEKTQKQYFFKYLNDLLKYPSCQAENKEEENDFKQRKELLMQCLKTKSSILYKNMNNFYVLSNYDEVY